jgi:hypothetical protein
MKLSLCFVTARRDPQIEAMLESLAPQVRHDDEIELVIVDFYARNRALPLLTMHPAIRGGIVLTPPKPCIWQGPHRVTAHDFWAMSNARNTALCYARHGYVAFLDDRVVLSPAWLEVVRRHEWLRRSAICGPYDKIEIDHPTGAERRSIDHRKQHAPGGRFNCGGSWYFGGNFALPLAWALEVNGFEEGCDSVGGEDYIFGTMLANAGHPIEFCAEMSAVQDRRSIDHPFPRVDKGRSPLDKSHAMMDRWGRKKHTEFTPDLRALRELALAGKPLPPPGNGCHRDWYDDAPIAEIVPPP